jgi:hypothetical protein
MIGGKYPNQYYACDRCGKQITKTYTWWSSRNIKYVHKSRKGLLLYFCSSFCKDKHVTNNVGRGYKPNPAEKWVYKNCGLVVYSEESKKSPYDWAEERY